MVEAGEEGARKTPKYYTQVLLTNYTTATAVSVNVLVELPLSNRLLLSLKTTMILS